jgi:hypothetical protein
MIFRNIICQSPVALTPEQIAAQKEANERDQERRLEWAMILQALSDNSAAVTRAMRQWYPREGDRVRHVERVMTSYGDGSFLIDRLGAWSSIRISPSCCSICDGGSRMNTATHLR